VEKRQRKFLIIVMALVGLILLIAGLIQTGRRKNIPAPVTPVPTEKTALPDATPGVSPTKTPSVAGTPLPGVTSSPNIKPSPTTVTETPEVQKTHDFYVAVDGDKQNDGSKEHPWPLQYALNGPSALQPGDTIWLRGGEYRGTFTLRLKGEEGREITVRAMPGERAILENDGLVLDISTSQFVNLWGLEITATQNSRDPQNRSESAYGVRINQSKDSNHIKFINMIVHDMPAQGFGWWRANTDSEIYGSLIYFNGTNQFDHGIYVMNDHGEKQIVDNIIFDNASHGIHAYGEKDGQLLDNIHIQGNTVFNNGSIGYDTKRGVYGDFQRNILLGGRLVADSPVVVDNYTYYPGASGEAFNLGYRAGTNNAVVEGNYFVGGSVTLGGNNPGITMKQNTISGLGIASIANLAFQGNDLLFTRPRSSKIFVRPNQYEAGRANITVYNWLNQDQIVLTAEDLKGVVIQAGDRYELHNAQDYFNDVVSGVYDGKQIEIPMTGHSVAQPLGLSFKPATTFPAFGAFVLITIGQ
jgi:hypothetical protein